MQNVNTKYKFIEIVSYSDLINWSVQYLKDTSISFNKKYPLVSMNSFLKRNKTSIEIENDKEYKRATIKVRNGGIFLRDIEKGQNIGTKNQFLIKAGQFLLSKIDARNGAFGVVPEELDGGIITGNFWTFDVDYSKVNPHYLSLVATTPQFIKFSEQASNGTTNRHYLQEEAFLNIKIPLPSIDEQNKIFEAFHKKMKLAEEQELKSNEIENIIERYILDELSISVSSQNKMEKGIKFVSFKNISFWGVEKLSTINNSDLLCSSKYKNYPLSQLVYVNPRTELKEFEDSFEMSFIPMECISDDFGEWTEKRVGQKSQSTGYTKFKENDLIWARITPCMQNGKSAVVRDLRNGFGYGSTEFHVLRQKDNSFSIKFLYNILRLKIIRLDAMSHFTGSAGQQRVPKFYLESLSVPKPPLDVQNQIINKVQKLKSEIKQLKQQAQENRINALIEFEKEIFNI